MADEAADIKEEYKKPTFFTIAIAGLLSLVIIILWDAVDYMNGMIYHSESVVFALAVPGSVIVCLGLVLSVAAFKSSASKDQTLFYTFVLAVFHLAVWIIQLVCVIDLEDDKTPFEEELGEYSASSRQTEVIIMMVLSILCFIALAIGSILAIMEKTDFF